MSNMPNTYDQSDVHLYQEPERTSVMAILSLVFGIVGCCTLVTAPIGLILGFLGLVGIRRSHGRVGGMGFAIAGIVISLISLLFTSIAVGFSFAFANYIKQSANTTESILVSIQNHDYEAARQLMLPPASDMTDEGFAAFQAAYSADLGNIVGPPTGLNDYIKAYGVVIDQYEPYNGRPGYIPLPKRFDSDWALVILVTDTSGGTHTKLEKLILIGPDGKEYTLPPNAGDVDSVNQPVSATGAQSAPDSSQPDQAPGGENADTPETDEPEGP